MAPSLVKTHVTEVPVEIQTYCRLSYSPGLKSDQTYRAFTETLLSPVKAHRIEGPSLIVFFFVCFFLFTSAVPRDLPYDLQAEL